MDYPGDMLSQVIVVSPGLPQFNTERELLKAYYQEFYGHGFGATGKGLKPDRAGAGEEVEDPGVGDDAAEDGEASLAHGVWRRADLLTL